MNGTIQSSKTYCQSTISGTNGHETHQRRSENDDMSSTGSKSEFEWNKWSLGRTFLRNVYSVDSNTAPPILALRKLLLRLSNWSQVIIRHRNASEILQAPINLMRSEGVTVWSPKMPSSSFGKS